MSWIAIVITAHVLNAVNFVIDKFLLTKKVSESFVYTFAIGILGMFVLVLIPFGFEIPAPELLALNFFTGFTFILALLCFFRSLQFNEASRIVPFIGTAIPLMTLMFSFFFLHERLSAPELFAFGVLIFGTYLISRDTDSKKSVTLKGIGIALLAAFFFAVSFVLNKYVFETQPFISGFIWIRIGSFILVISLLFSKKRRIAVKNAWKKNSSKIKLLFVGNQMIGAAAFLLLSYSISLAAVSLVNALQGVQYMILLVGAFVISLKNPKLLSENFSPASLRYKVLGVLVISAGLAMLSYYAA